MGFLVLLSGVLRIVLGSPITVEAPRFTVEAPRFLLELFCQIFELGVLIHEVSTGVFGATYPTAQEVILMSSP
jgi:hypothetical protein